MSTEAIFKELTAYNIRFVEHPHPEFNNLPVCPFAKKARLEGKLQYEICNLNITDMLAQIENWRVSKKQALILVIPDKEMYLSDYLLYFELIRATLPIDLNVFGAHPDAGYLFHGVYTRREPYPNFQIIEIDVLEHAHEQLLHSRWYEERFVGNKPGEILDVWHFENDRYDHPRECLR